MNINPFYWFKGRPIMSPDPPRWGEFINALDEFCNFHEDENGELVWGCQHNTAGAEKLLEGFGVNVKKSLAYFEKHGGFYDCEILLNVAAGSSVPGRI